MVLDDGQNSIVETDEASEYIACFLTNTTPFISATKLWSRAPVTYETFPSNSPVGNILAYSIWYTPKTSCSPFKMDGRHLSFWDGSFSAVSSWFQGGYLMKVFFGPPKNPWNMTVLSPQKNCKETRGTPWWLVYNSKTPWNWAVPRATWTHRRWEIHLKGKKERLFGKRPWGKRIVSTYPNVN